VALLDKWVISSTPSQASVEHFYHQAKIKHTPVETGSSIQIPPTRRLRFISPVESPGRTFQTHRAFITSFHAYNVHSASYTLHHFITYTCTQCSYLFQTHNSLITSFRRHITFASHAS
jgi:hypothetical protein